MDTRKYGLSSNLTWIYTTLLQYYGPQHWWPGDGPFEMMVGAVLTQSTSWTNVEKAIQNLKRADSLTPAALRNIDFDRLAVLIHPSGYHHAKAKKLKSLVGWLSCYHDDLVAVFSKDQETLRQELLAVYGVGEETADSILLYAAGKPVFVIDAYTRRILNRIGIFTAGNKYTDYQELFMCQMPPDPVVFNEYHALLVKHGKSTCRKKPQCRECCLFEVCRNKPV